MSSTPATVTFSAVGRIKDGTFTPAAHGRITVTLKDAAGTPIDRFDVAPNSPRSRGALTRKYPITDADVIRCCDDARNGTPVVFAAPVEVTQPLTHVSLTIREMDSDTGATTTGTTLDTLKQLLPTIPTSKLLCWKGTDALSCLDIDYHDTKPPLRTHLETWVETRVHPKPVAWHFSRSGGLHLFYVAVDGFTASELACAAAIRYRLLDPTAGLEPTKTQVRGPGDEVVRWVTPDSSGASSPILGGSGEVDETSIEDYCAAHGIELGQRYDHNKCPIDPTDEPGARQPVTVGDLGVFCHRCAGKGYSLGSRRPGFAPWGSLTGTPSGGEVGTMVRNMTHWGHARWVLTQKYEIEEAHAREGYSAALRQFHGEDYTDAHKSLVFNRDTLDLTRSNDLWKNLDSSYTYPGTGLPPLLAALPGVQYVTDKGLKPSAASVAYLSQGHDLSARGYGNINVIHGYRMARQFLPPPEQTQVSMVVRQLRNKPCGPKYVPRSKRMSMSEAEGIFLDSSRFPLLDMQCLRVLVCAQAVAQETRLGLHPLLFITGHTGAAKTTTVKLAAGITGTSAPDVAFSANEERLKSSIAYAGETGSFACGNEFIKDYYRLTRRNDPRAALEPFLTITPETQNHVLFTGPRRLGKLVAMVITEPSCPYVIRQMHQLARRFRYVRLHGKKTAWQKNMATMGLTPDTLHLYRLSDPLLATAADAIMSDLIDRYFSAPMSWDDIAEDLGVPTILDSDAFEDENAHLLRLYELVCQAPEISDPRLQKVYAEGYKLIHRNDTPTELDQELSDLWSMFADVGHDGWVRGQTLEEKQWSDILQVSDPVLLDIKARGSNTVLVRFRVGPPKCPLRLNGDITAKS